MVFNSKMVLSTVKVSTGVWQTLACLPERLTNEELVNVFFRFPLQQMRRLARCLLIFFLTPPNSASGSSYHEDYDSEYTYRSGDDDNSDDGYITYQYYNESHSD
ncbi:unnamed protein product [Rhodiola kirilowii]